jgi:hypothetical protein
MKNHAYSMLLKAEVQETSFSKNIKGGNGSDILSIQFFHINFNIFL